MKRLPGDRARRFLAAIEGGADPAKVARHVVRSGQAEVKDRLLHETYGACEGCDTTLPDDSMMHLHHVVPVSRGGSNADKNVTLLCPNCHALAHWFDRQFDERPEDRTALLIRVRDWYASRSERREIA